MQALVKILPGRRGLAAFEITEPVIVRGYTIPAGFVSDGESIPWFAQSVFPRASEALLAAFAHDHRMSTAKTVEERFNAHRHFREDLRLLGVSNWRSQVMWRAAMGADDKIPIIRRLKSSILD